MANIYQEIWDADQLENGVPALLPDSTVNPARGYVIVDERVEPESDQHKLFKDVSIPEKKMKTYTLCKRLFNNFNLDQNRPEPMDTPEEEEEREALLEAVVGTRPMQVAREYISAQTNTAYNDGKWKDFIRGVWFTRYNMGRGMDLTGFEHIACGEQSGTNVSGYHFWYKYYLDDSHEFLNSDDILYHGTAYEFGTDKAIQVPEVATLSYVWDAFDFVNEERQRLNKRIGGFFIGCSIEGLMAMGTVRFFPDAGAPKRAIINRAEYFLAIARGNNDNSIRTFYPEFQQLTDETQQQSGSPGIIIEDAGTVKIVAALINPLGDDQGNELVTLINVSPDTLNLHEWTLEGDNGNKHHIMNLSLSGGEAKTIQLRPEQAQLINNDGRIVLRSASGFVIHEVVYTREQIENDQQGWTVVF